MVKLSIIPPMVPMTASQVGTPWGTGAAGGGPMTEISSIPTTRRQSRAFEGHRRRARRGGGARRAALAVVPLALLGSGAFVYQASNAAFTASTSTGSNTWAAGNVFLT